MQSMKLSAKTRSIDLSLSYRTLDHAPKVSNAQALCSTMSACLALIGPDFGT
jgi:hypothetical protein